MLRDEQIEVAPTWAHDEQQKTIVVEKHQEIDRELRRIAKKRAGLDIDEAQWLREAERHRVWRKLGFSTALEYLEDVFGYAPRTALERLRVAKELGQLPKLEAEVRKGALPYSAARELTRVMTPKTEDVWLAHARGKNLRDIEELVSGHVKGDDPRDPKNPDVTKRAVVLELSPRSVAMLHEIRAMISDECGAHADDEQLVEVLYRRMIDDAPASTKAARRPHRIVVFKCDDCGRSWQDCGGTRVQLTESELARAECDAEIVDATEAINADEVNTRVNVEEVNRRVHVVHEAVTEIARAASRPKSNTPTRIRNEVWARDHGRCRVPGCRAKRHLDVHHIIARILGGTHDPWNLLVLCSGHHKLLHAGIISITGRAPDQLVFMRGDKPLVDSRSCAETRASERLREQCTAKRPSFAEVAKLEQAKQGLLQLGFNGRAARDALERACAHVGADADVSKLVQTALELTRNDETPTSETRSMATQALVQMGFPRGLASAAVDDAFADVGDDDLANLIREALRRCGSS